MVAKSWTRLINFHFLFAEYVLGVLCAWYYFRHYWKSLWLSRDIQYCKNKLCMSGIKELPGSSGSIEPTCQCSRHKRCKFDPGSSRYLGEGNGSPLQHACWRIPWTDEPGRLQYMGSQRVRHNWACMHLRFKFRKSIAIRQKVDIFASVYLTPCLFLFSSKIE